MKRIIKLKESDLKNVIKRIISELKIIDISDQSDYRKAKLTNRDYFMVHHTAGLGTAQDVVRVLNTPTPKRPYILGVQWVVDLDGKIYRTLPVGNLGAHVGNNSRNRKVSNSNTEGVEVVGKDDDDIKRRHDADIANGILPKQAESVRQLVKYLGYSQDQLVGHGEVSNNRSPSEGQTIIKYIRQNWDKPIDSTLKVSDLKMDDESVKSDESSNISNLITDSDKSQFMRSFMEIAKKDVEFKYKISKGGRIQYSPDIEKVQIALEFLGYDLPRWGIDGKFGPETESAVKKFQSKNNLDETGVVTKKDLQYLFAHLVVNKFEESDVYSILLNKEESFLGVSVADDKEFYDQILKGIGAPITKSNLKFLYAWRQAEGGKATNNPFNTTLKLKNDEKKTNYNSVGVKNYSTPSYGVEATVKTLLNGYYDCIVDGLRNDSGAERISKMCVSQLKTWGTGGLVDKVLQYDTITPPPIYSA